jgi:hypothetical protein
MTVVTSPGSVIGNAMPTRRVPISARDASPAARRSRSATAAPVVSAVPSPMAKITGAATIPVPGTFTSSPFRPVAPSAVNAVSRRRRAVAFNGTAAASIVTDLPRPGEIPRTKASTLKVAGSAEARVMTVIGILGRLAGIRLAGTPGNHTSSVTA